MAVTGMSMDPDERRRRWACADRVLCVRLDTLGDVLMSTPAIRALKDVRASRRITLLTSPAAAPIAPLIPEISGLITYDAPWMKHSAGRRDSRADHHMIERLKQGRFDAAVIFTVYSQSALPAALLCFLADIPLRLAHCRENPYQLLTDWVLDPEPDGTTRHEVRRQLDLVATVEARTADERLSVRVSAAAARAAQDCVEELLGPQSGRPWAIIHPGATAASRRYPAESFAVAARRLVRDVGCEVIFTGTAEETDLIESIRREMAAPSRSVAGRLDVDTLAAFIALAPLLISNNTGPVHIAAAVGTPVVDLYALTNPQHTPWQVPHRLLFHDVDCKYCYKSVCPEGHHDCLRLVSPDAVVQAAVELLEEHKRISSLVSRISSGGRVHSSF